ncbi:MAG: hypothetical protein Q9181_004826 [Wetmoreana brouardii]
MEDYSPDRCDRLLGEMPADVAPPVTWGPRGEAGIDKVLPCGWELRQIGPQLLMTIVAFKCRLNVWGAFGSRNVRDRMSYYEVWTAGVMMAGMCARYGKPGRYENLGQDGRLWVLLDDGSGLQDGSAAGNQTVRELDGDSLATWDGSLSTA